MVQSLQIQTTLIILLLFGHDGFAQQIHLVHNMKNPSSSDTSFGHALAFDGTIALVGAPLANLSDTLGMTGVVYVYHLNGNSSFWIPETNFVSPSSVSFDRFGYSVGISGNFALIGAPSHPAKGLEAGAAYIFQNLNGSWVQVAMLLASDARPYDNFGTSVAIRGSYAIVGAPHSTGDATVSGAAYIFARSPDGNWTQKALLRAPGPTTDDHFGESVALSKDGTTAIIGAHNSDMGAAYVFLRSGTAWSGEAQLTGQDSDPNFGREVAVHADTAVVTADGSGGAVYVFVRSEGMWVRDALVRGVGVQFGLSVALPSDSMMLVAAGSTLSAGQVYLFERGSTNWALSTTILSETSYPGDGFGDPLAMSQNIVIATSKSQSPNSTDYVFYSGFVSCPSPTVSPPHCLPVPSNWTCPAVYYDDHSYCNCTCGVEDPDCIGTQICPPAEWTCPPSYWNDHICDCACGPVPDIDCLSPPICHRPPPSWTCGPAFWGDGICDCYCGPVQDPDCSRARYGCPPWNWTCSFADYNDAACSCLCGTTDPGCAEGACPVIWSCPRLTWNDGECDCGCGSRDVFDCKVEECPSDVIIIKLSALSGGSLAAAITIPIVFVVILVLLFVCWLGSKPTKSPAKAREVQPLSQLVYDGRRRPTSFHSLVAIPKSGLRTMATTLQAIPSRFKYSLGKNPVPGRTTYGSVSTGPSSDTTLHESLAQRVKQKVVHAGTTTVKKLKEVTSRFKGRITRPNFSGNPDEESVTTRTDPLEPVLPPCDTDEPSDGGPSVMTAESFTSAEMSAPTTPVLRVATTVTQLSEWNVPPPLDTPPQPVSDIETSVTPVQRTQENLSSVSL